MPPAVVDVGLERDNHYDGQHKAAEQQDAKADFAVAEGGKGASDCLPTYCRRADSAKRQRDRRRGDGEPNGYVVPRHGVRHVSFAHKQVWDSEHNGMLRHHAHTLNKPQRVFPVVRMNDVHRRKCHRQERRAGKQDALALSAIHLPQV